MAVAPSSVHTRSTPVLAGWPIVGWSALAVAALCAVVFLAAGGGEVGWRAAIRLSAKTSLALFTAAFVASSIRGLWPNELTRWLLANRRYVGVSFAASHGIHLFAILALLWVAPGFEIQMPTLIGGGLAYVFLGAMTATSFDRTAAWLGARRWRLLHKTGMYYCWFIFFISYVPRMLVESPLYVSYVAVLLGGVGLRAVAARRGAARRAVLG
jgi:methionine sulfoxide reductase heme-binding subunit